MYIFGFAKAFDKVLHLRLITKLKAHGVDGNVAKWNFSWLTGRMQRVVINGECSCWRNVSSVVLQDSV